MAVGLPSATSLALQGPPTATIGGSVTSFVFAMRRIVSGSNWMVPSSSGQKPLEVSSSASAFAMPGRAISTTFGTPTEATAQMTTSVPSRACSSSPERKSRVPSASATFVRGWTSPRSHASSR